MREIDGMHRGDLHLSEDTRIGSGAMVNGSVRVAAGVTARIDGMVRGDVLADPGARVTVTGMISGRLVQPDGSGAPSGAAAPGPGA